MQDINGFRKILEHLSKGLMKGENTKNTIAEVVNSVIKSDITSKNVSIKQKELVLSGNLDKTLLFLKKDQILKEIKGKTNLDLKSIIS